MANREKEQTWISKLKALDAFPKQREEAAEFFHRSVSGGVITMVAALMMTILFFSELGLYVRVRTVNELTVDTSRGETMEIHVSTRSCCVCVCVCVCVLREMVYEI
jgi:hypothetical protein